MSAQDTPQGRFSRLVRGRGKDAAAWDEKRTSEADRRRLAEVQDAKRARRGDTVAEDADVVPQDAGGPAAAAPVPDDTKPVPDAQPRVAGLGARKTRSQASQQDDVTLRLEPANVPDADTTGRDAAQISVLVVCTGNVCRSPFFERVLVHELRGLPVEVSGAGTGALLIDRMASGSAALLAARGIDPGGFRPRQLTADMVARADLVLTATREHRRMVAEEAPAQAHKVFALLDFADVCAASDATRRAGGGDGFRTFVREARAGVLERRSTRSEEEAAVLDPFRQPQEMFERMAAESVPALSLVADTVRGFLTVER